MVVFMIMQFLYELYEKFTYFLAPPYCLVCKDYLHLRQPFCNACKATILPVAPYDFMVTPTKKVAVYALSAYKEPLRTLVLAKHQRNQIYTIFLAQLMSQHSILQHIDADIITFIPLHWTRYASRGFNQAQIIAQQLGKVTGKQVIPLIIRRKKTQFQARLPLHEREKNVSDAFVLDEQFLQAIAGKKILIVDDLFTTGSTIKAVSLLLFAHRPMSISVFVACRVV